MSQAKKTIRTLKINKKKAPVPKRIKRPFKYDAESHVTIITKTKNTHVHFGDRHIYGTSLSFEKHISIQEIRDRLANWTWKDGMEYRIATYCKSSGYISRGVTFIGNNFIEDAVYDPRTDYGDDFDSNTKWICIYSHEAPDDDGGRSLHNDCLFEAIKSSGLFIPCKYTAESIKKQLGINRNDKIPVGRIEEIEKILKIPINVCGDYRHNSQYTKLYQKQVCVKLINGHYELLQNNEEKFYNLKLKKAQLYIHGKDNGINYICYKNKKGEFKTDSYTNHFEFFSEIGKKQQNNVCVRYTKILRKKKDDKTYGPLDLSILADHYTEYMKYRSDLYEDFKIDLLCYKSIVHCARDILQQENVGVTSPDAIDEIEAHFIKKSYGGGHMQSKDGYNGPCIGFDKNSAYASVMMMNTNVPIRKGTLETYTQKEFDQLENIPTGFYIVNIIPKSGVAFKKASKTPYLKYYTSSDIYYARRNGFKINILQNGQANAYIYDEIKCVKFYDIFSNYINKFMDSKKKGRSYAKEFLNVLSGATAQKKKTTKHGSSDRPLDLPPSADIDITKTISNKDLSTTSVEYVHWDDYFCWGYARISPFLTSNCRARMWGLINKIPAERVLRCQTDSVLLTDVTGYEHLFKIDAELGNYKIEHYGNCKITHVNSIIYDEKELPQELLQRFNTTKDTRKQVVKTQLKAPQDIKSFIVSKIKLSNKNIK